MTATDVRPAPSPVRPARRTPPPPLSAEREHPEPSRTPGLLGVVEVVKTRVAVAGAHRASVLLRRPRFLRGPYVETPLDAAPVHTPRLRLRPYTMADAPAWYRLQSDPAVVRYLPWPIRDRDASREHLRDRTRHIRLWQCDDLLALAIERDGAVIGDVALQLRAVARDVRTVEMSWIIDPVHGGRGYATEASLAMAQLAFAALGARILTAVVRSENDRSLALAHRIGFRETHRDGHTVLLTLSTIDFLDTLAGTPRLRELLGPSSLPHAQSTASR